MLAALGCESDWSGLAYAIGVERGDVSAPSSQHPAEIWDFDILDSTAAILYGFERNMNGGRGMTRASIQARQQTERRFPVRVRIAVPPEGLGRQIEIMHAWLDETCGAQGWGMAPAGLVGVLNDAIAFYFDDAAFAHAFVARFCCGYRVEAVEGAFALRNDTPPLRRGAPVHKTP